MATKSGSTDAERGHRSEDSRDALERYEQELDNLFGKDQRSLSEEERKQREERMVELLRRIDDLDSRQAAGASEDSFEGMRSAEYILRARRDKLQQELDRYNDLLPAERAKLSAAEKRGRMQFMKGLDSAIRMLDEEIARERGPELGFDDTSADVKPKSVAVSAGAGAPPAPPRVPEHLKKSAAKVEGDRIFAAAAGGGSMPPAGGLPEAEKDADAAEKRRLAMAMATDTEFPPDGPELSLEAAAKHTKVAGSAGAEKMESGAKKKIRVILGDFSESVIEHGHEIAERSMTRRKEDNRTRGLRGIADSVITHGIFRELNVRMSAINKRRDILREGNFFAGQRGMTDVERRTMHERVVKSVIDRAQVHLDTPDEEIRQGALSTKEWVRDAGEGEKVSELKSALTGLVAQFSSDPSLTREAFDLRRREIYSQLGKSVFGEAAAKERETNSFATGGRADLVEDNLWEHVEALRPEVGHASGVEALDLDIDLKLMGARFGAETEAKKDLVDDIMAKLSNAGQGEGNGVRHRMAQGVGVLAGSLENYVAVGVAAALGGRKIAGAVTRAASWASGVAFAIPAFSTMAGAIGINSYQEYKRHAKELHFHERERAKGQVFEGLNEDQVKQLAAKLHEQKQYASWVRPSHRKERARIEKEIEQIHFGADNARRLEELRTRRKDTGFFSDERRQIDEEIARISGSLTPERRRRLELEQFSLERLGAKGTSERLRALSAVSLEGMTPEERHQWLHETVQVAADAEARTRLGDIHSRDFFAYSSAEALEEEKLQLLVSRAELKSKMRSAFDQTSAGVSFDDWYNAFYAPKARSLETELSDVDNAFKSYRQREVWQKAKTMAKFGAAIGLVANEVYAAFSDQTRGVVDMVRGTDGAAKSGTLIARAAEFLHGAMDAGRAHVINLVSGGTIETPSGVQLVPDGHGGFNLLDHGRQVATGLEVDAFGRLEPQSAQELRDAGYSLQETSTTLMQSGSGTRQVVGTADFLNTFNPDQVHTVAPDLTKRIDLYDHYTFETAKKFESTEQMLDWGGAKGSGIDINPATGKEAAVLDIGRMLETLDTPSIHADRSPANVIPSMEINRVIDPATGQRAIDVLLFPDSSHPDKAVSLMIPAAGPERGKAFIDLDSPLGQALFSKDANGHAVFKGWKMIAAHLDGTTRPLANGDTGEFFRSIAMANGQDIAGAGGQRGFEVFAPDTQQEIWRTVINPGNRDTDLWFVPMITRGARERLTAGREKSGPAGLGKGISREYGAFGYYAYGKETEGSDFSERVLPMLKENPQLDVHNDKPIIEAYFATLSPEYLRTVDELVRDVPAMRNDIEAVVTVPSYHEAGNLEKTFAHYAGLEHPERFEIVLFENHPKAKGRDATPDVVAAMKKKYPQLNIVHLYHEFLEKQNIGLIRKYLVDAVLRRKQQSGVEHELAIISNDADLEGIDAKYVDKVIDTLKANPEVDAVVGALDFTEEGYRQYPHLHATQRMWQFLDRSISRYVVGSPEMIGPTSAFRSGIYAAIGGYNPESSLGEDLEIGWSIRAGRNWQGKRIKYIPSAEVISNPRRAIVKMLSGSTLINRYDDFAENEDIRRKSPEELLAMRKDYDINEMKREIQGMYDFYVSKTRSRGGWADDAGVQKAFSRAMLFAGIKYRIEGDEVVFLDDSAMVRGLEKFGAKFAREAELPAPVAGDAAAVDPQEPAAKDAPRAENAAKNVSSDTGGDAADETIRNASKDRSVPSSKSVESKDRGGEDENETEDEVLNGGDAALAEVEGDIADPEAETAELMSPHEAAVAEIAAEIDELRETGGDHAEARIAELEQILESPQQLERFVRERVSGREKSPRQRYYEIVSVVRRDVVPVRARRPRSYQQERESYRVMFGAARRLLGMGPGDGQITAEMLTAGRDKVMKDIEAFARKGGRGVRKYVMRTRNDVSWLFDRLGEEIGRRELRQERQNAVRAFYEKRDQFIQARRDIARRSREIDQMVGKRTLESFKDEEGRPIVTPDIIDKLRGFNDPAAERFADILDGINGSFDAKTIREALKSEFKLIRNPGSEEGVKNLVREALGYADLTPGEQFDTTARAANAIESIWVQLLKESYRLREMIAEQKAARAAVKELEQDVVRARVELEQKDEQLRGTTERRATAQPRRPDARAERPKERFKEVKKDRKKDDRATSTTQESRSTEDQVKNPETITTANTDVDEQPAGVDTSSEGPQEATGVTLPQPESNDAVDVAAAPSQVAEEIPMNVADEVVPQSMPEEQGRDYPEPAGMPKEESASVAATPAARPMRNPVPDTSAERAPRVEAKQVPPVKIAVLRAIAPASRLVKIRKVNMVVPQLEKSEDGFDRAMAPILKTMLELSAAKNASEQKDILLELGRRAGDDVTEETLMPTLELILDTELPRVNEALQKDAEKKLGKAFDRLNAGAQLKVELLDAAKKILASNVKK